MAQELYLGKAASKVLRNQDVPADVNGCVHGNAAAPEGTSKGRGPPLRGTAPRRQGQGEVPLRGHFLSSPCFAFLEKVLT